MVSTISLLPLASAAVAAALTVLALLNSGRGSRQRTLFAALNVAVAAWCLGFFLEVNFDAASMAGADTTAFAPMGSWAWAVHMLASLGAAAAPALWFLFAADRTGRTRWLSGWRLALVCVPGVFSVLTMATNALHRLAISPGSGAATLGPLAMLDQTAAFVLIVAGAWVFGVSALRNPEPRARASGLRIVAAAALPVFGGIVFFARAAIGVPMSVNLPPELFVALELVLAYEVLFAGLTDVGPVPGPLEGHLGKGAVIVVDEKLAVRQFTPAAIEAFPGLAQDAALLDALPEIARHTEVCMFYGLDQLAFEVQIGARNWWGRVQRRVSTEPTEITCVVQLTDLGPATNAPAPAAGDLA